jgi:Spy/CpxP family protein refolding chaperone
MQMKFPTNRIATPALRRITLAATTALALALGSTATLAQPAGPMMGGGFGGHGGPGMHAMQGGGIDGMLPRALEQAKASLNLTQQQLVDWDAAVAAGKAAREAARASRQQVKDALKAELAKAEPNLEAVAAMADGVRAQNQEALKQVRTKWIRLYSTFTLAQKAIVRDLLQQKLARAEAMHGRMVERMQQRWGATGN